jgi:PilZ domain
MRADCLESPKAKPEAVPDARTCPIPRSRRYSVDAPLTFRMPGELEWSYATIVNMSRSGILFRTKKPLQVKTILEMRIILSATGARFSDIIATGAVARTDSFLAAVSIRQYRFAPPSI